MYKLYFWKSKINQGNFGDELSPIIINKLYGTNVPTTNLMSYPKKFLAVGSVLHLGNTNDIIWGTGIRTYEHEYNFKNLRVYGVRGLFTRKFLLDRKINVPEIYGDPALLYSQIFDINKQEAYEYEIGFVPHYTQYEDYLKLLKNNIKYSNIHIINPTNNYKSVISDISKSKYIISSSLHGLIISDSLNIPNIMLYEKNLNEGKLKFQDYYSSQNRDLDFINNLDEFYKNPIKEYGNHVDLEKLIESFPRKILSMNITSNNLKKK